MAYIFEIKSGWDTFKIGIALFPGHPAFLKDRIGFWRCLPGHLAISKGGCDYYNPQMRLNLYNREPTPFSSPQEFVEFPSTMIATIWLPDRWAELSNGDQGKIVYFPYGAGVSRSNQSSDGWVSRSGEWTAKEGFANS